VEASVDDLVGALKDVLEKSLQLPCARKKFFEAWVNDHFSPNGKTVVEIFSELEFLEAKRELEVISDEFEWCKSKSFDIYHGFF
jgi:hypothetical protein